MMVPERFRSPSNPETRKQMHKIVQLLGLPPAHMLLQAGQKSKVKHMFRQRGQVLSLSLSRFLYFSRSLSLSL